jgi:HD-GYP domain-containing protein (c-di-GMP phosphodiesterase class II)
MLEIPKLAIYGEEFDDEGMYNHEGMQEIARSAKGLTFKRTDNLVDWLFRKLEEVGMHSMWIEHFIKVGELSEEAMHQFAEWVGAKKQRYPLIRIGGMLHDIGKAGYVGEDGHGMSLNGEMPMTKKDLKYIRLHPQVGWSYIVMLDPKGALSLNKKEIADCVLYHQENWNGSGYPFGLKGKNIPPSARIVSVVDFIDAAGDKNRIWYPTLSHDKIRSMLKEDAGVTYDPVVAGMFYEMLEEKHVCEYLGLHNGNCNGASGTRITL